MFLTMPTINRPIKVLNTLPSPPKKLVPPIIAAVMSFVIHGAIGQTKGNVGGVEQAGQPSETGYHIRHLDPSHYPGKARRLTVATHRVMERPRVVYLRKNQVRR